MRQRTYKQRPYDIAMSFAGKDRQKVEQVADYLSLFGVKVFYDNWERHNLIGEDLYTYLAEIYQNKATYCAMFISKAYVTKAWPRHERQFAQARSFSSRKPYILPIKLDNSKCPGIPPTLGFIDGKKTKPHEIAILLLKRLGKELYRGDYEAFMLKRFMKWQILWDGTVKARGNFRLLHLGRLKKRRITNNIWSPDDRPLNLKDVAVRVSGKKQRTKISSTVETSHQSNTILDSPLEFGNILNYEISYRCQNYYDDVKSLCKDDFNVGVHMLSWDYDFIFPRNSILKSFQLFRRVGGDRYRQAYDSTIEKGCPVIHFSFARPKVGSRLEIQFKLGKR